MNKIRLKNTGGLMAAMTLVLMFGFGCSFFEDDFSEMYSVQQSGGMICIIKNRYAVEIKVTRPISKGELFLYGREYKPAEFPDLVVRSCSALNDKLMIVGADDGGYLLFENENGGYELKKINGRLGVPSSDLPWFVDDDRRKNALTGETVMFKGKLPSFYMGNSPDWKTIVTEGENLVEKDLISLYVVDMETGIAEKRFVRRANYMFLLDFTKGGAAIGKHFGWLPDAKGKFQLVYPVLEPKSAKAG